MMKHTRLLVVLGILGSLGCLRHPDMRVESQLTVAQLGGSVPVVSQDVQYFDTAESHGRFPASIAVARVTTRTGNSTESLKLFPLRAYESAYWVELFDGTPEVLEMIVIHERSVRQLQIQTAELFEAAAVMRAKLLLIYGYDNVGTPDTCRVSGWLYEIPSQKLLAGLNKTVTRSEAEQVALELPKDQKPKTESDWAYYVDYLAFRGFEKSFRECTWSLIDRDLPSEGTLPSPFGKKESNAASPTGKEEASQTPAYPKNWRP